jgi:hypothetical protein
LCNYIVRSLLPLFSLLCHRSLPSIGPLFPLQSFSPIYHIYIYISLWAKALFLSLC